MDIHLLKGTSQFLSRFQNISNEMKISKDTKYPNDNSNFIIICLNQLPYDVIYSGVNV